MRRFLESPHRLTRRTSLAALGALAWPLPSQADDAARLRPLATRSNCLAIARGGMRLVAVGERGHVLLSDDEGKTWRQARSVPVRTLLTSVHAIDGRNFCAVGHGGVILRSSDGGEAWQVVLGKAGGADVLLSVYLDADGRGMAVGGFGLALRTMDGGERWAPVELIAGEAGERHLNQVFTNGGSSWFVAAEGGHVLRSGDRGAHWEAVKTPYKGSLWCGTALGGGVLLAAGMRGNVLRSTDDGRQWTHQTLAGAGSFTSVAALPDQRAVLVGVDGTLALGERGGERFAVRTLDDRATITGVVALTDAEVAVSTALGPRRVPVQA